MSESKVSSQCITKGVFSRRAFLKVLSASAGAAAIGLPSITATAENLNSGTEPARRPNIIFLLTDDQRWDTMGCAGNPIIHTPNMDSLANNGVRFTNAFVTTSICAASRASILTGTWERTHGYTFGTGPIPSLYADNSYPVLLRNAGYHTGFVGKFGVGVDGGQKTIAQMFDSFVPLDLPYYFRKMPDGSTRHLTEIEGDKAIEFLRASKPDVPFCLSVSFNAPHADDSEPQQYFWPHTVDGLYKDVHIPPPQFSSPEFFESLPPFLKNSMNRERWGWRFDTPEKYQEMVKGYYRMVSGVDSVIGKIREELKMLNMDKNTVIILMGDNGYFLGDRGFADKWLGYEQSLRVPLVIYDPRKNAQKAGLTPSENVLNVDIAPTICDMAGVVRPVTYEGMSMIPLCRQKKLPWRKDFLFEHLLEMFPTIPRCEGVRENDWKYIRYQDVKPVYEELYDLKNDPAEAKNRATDRKYADVLQRLRRRTDELINAYTRNIKAVPYSKMAKPINADKPIQPKSTATKE